MFENGQGSSVRRRHFLGMLFYGSVGAMVAACGQAQPTSPTSAPAAQPTAASSTAQNTTSAATPTTSTAQATAAPASTPAMAAASGPIRFRSWWSPAAGKTYTDWDTFIKKDFPAKNPAAQLSLEYVPFGDYWKKFLTSVAASDVPDVMHTSVAWGRDLYDLNTLSPLNDYMRANSEMDPSLLLPYSLPFWQTGGKYFGFPWEGPDAVGGLFYNTKMFKDAGIDPTYDVVKKWTWDDLAKNAQKLTKVSGSDISIGGFLVKIVNVAEFAALMYAQGGKFFANDDTENKTAFADGGKGIQAVQYLLDLLNKYKVSLPLAANRQDTNLFYQGKTAMFMTNIYSVATVHSDVPNLEFDMVPFPQGPGGSGPAVAGFANAHTIPAKAKNRDGGWDFVAWYCSLETEVNKMKIMDRPSVRKALFEDPAWTNRVKELPQLGRVTDAIQYGGIYPAARNQASGDAFNPIIQAMMLGKTTPEQGVKDAQKKIDDILSKLPEA